MFPTRVPMDRDSVSPEPLVYLFIHSFIHVCLLESPKGSPPAYGEKYKVTIHGAPRRRKAYIHWGADGEGELPVNSSTFLIKL